MKRTIYSTLSGILLFSLATSAQEKIVSADKDAKIEDIYAQINKLAPLADNDSAKNVLRLEAEALSKSSEEKKMSLAGNIYTRLLNDEEKGKQIEAQVLEKFPKGLYARSQAYNKIWENDEAPLDSLELKYEEWITTYPSSSFDDDEQSQSLYAYAQYTLSDKFLEAGNKEKAKKYLDSMKGSQYYSYGLTNYFEKSKDKDYAELSPLVEEAYNSALEASKSTDEKVNSGMTAQSLPSLTPLYAEVLANTNKTKEAIALIESDLEKEQYAGRSALRNSKTLATAYTAEGDKVKALSVYEKYITKNGVDKSILEETKSLYGDVKGTDANFDEWLASLEKQADAAHYAEYEKQMIKKEAPGFTLTDRDGKQVSLADYKGKVVVLDFWATWCGPCVVSFPGMQAAVNKYKEDNEVAFLFIDTWQREENYKELVEDFLTKNNYDIHVLFDEMKDNSKATVTAYGIQGIPTKVVIDKEGFIRFQTSGSEANVDKLVKELDIKIALAKKG